MRIPAFVLILVALAVALSSGGASAQESVLHTFNCPATTTVKLNWKNKIETQPTDFPVSPSYDNLLQPASFKGSAVSVPDNTVTCTYIIPQTVYQAPYTYKVHRKIISCSGQPGPTVTCNLKPN